MRTPANSLLLRQSIQIDESCLSWSTGPGRVGDGYCLVQSNFKCSLQAVEQVEHELFLVERTLGH